MSDITLLTIEKHAKICKKYPFSRRTGRIFKEKLLDSMVWVTQEGISISDKEFQYPIKILFDEINYIKEIEMDCKAVYINYANSEIIYFLFLSSFGWQEEKHNEFFELLQELLDQQQELRIDKLRANILEYISPYDEITFGTIADHFKLSFEVVQNEIKKMIENKKLKGKLCLDKIILREPLKEAFKINLFDYIKPYDEVTFESLSKHFKLDKDFIENEIKRMLKDGKLQGSLCSDKIILRERTPKLTLLKCPNCNAPLESKPPCKCDHCGVLIEISL